MRKGAAIVAGALLLALSGCATGSASTGRSPAAPPLFPAADLVEEVHGYRVADPYRPLEDPAASAAWIDAQNSRTRRYLDGLDLPDIRPRLSGMLSIGHVGDARPAGGRLFFMRRRGGQDQSDLVVIDGELSAERLLVDTAALDPSGKTTVDWYEPSPDGRLVAYGISANGSEDSTLHLTRTEDGRLLPDRIPDTRHASIAWLPDGSGFYYTRYPAGDRYNRRLWFHRLGDDPAADRPIVGEGLEKTDWIDATLSPDGRWLLVAVTKGWVRADVRLLDRGTGDWATVCEGLDALTWGFGFDTDGSIVAVTNHRAARGRVVRIDPSSPGVDNWKTVVPESAWTVEAAVPAGGLIYVAVLERAVSRLLAFDRQGGSAGEVGLPTLGAVHGIAAERGGVKVVLSFSSFLHPPVIIGYSAPDHRATETLAKVDGVGTVDLSRFVLTQVTYPSYDGTRVPMFLMHRKDVTPGRAPAILDGYGGFLVSMSPYFSRANLFWVERGGVFAVANLRGGGEFGEEWHRAGMRERKHQVFRDFEYAMRFLLREGYATVDRLCIRGGSNGGLLMGAMITQVPHLFRCAVSSVGLYDMVRYHLFPPGELWAEEYGTSDDPAGAGWLWGYSPYHQVIRGVAYPALLADTADTDTRVHWAHTTKFVAALQAASVSARPVLFWMDRKAGHGFGKSFAEIVDEYTDRFRFIMSETGDPAAAGSGR